MHALLPVRDRTFCPVVLVLVLVLLRYGRFMPAAHAFICIMYYTKSYLGIWFTFARFYRIVYGKKEELQVLSVMLFSPFIFVICWFKLP